MTTTPTKRMADLAKGISSAHSDVSTELTEFTSGGAMLDVRNGKGRLFVMAYTPTHGYGVDEVREDEGFLPGYQYSFTEFDDAADQLQRLIMNGNDNGQPHQETALNLVVIYSRDIEAAKRFYSCLGVSFQSEKHGKGPQHYAATLGPTVLEIYPCRPDSLSASARIGFRVESVDAVVDALRLQQAEICSEPRQSPWGRRAVLKDADGNTVELTEMARPAATS